jgi:hypothetical protein
VAIDRKAAVEYARKFWNRVADNDKFWISSAEISLAAKRKSMKAPAADGWEAFFVADGSGGEKAIFRRTVGGKTEDMPDPIAIWDDLDDCTHYVCRCLLKGGIALKETPRANELTETMIKSGKTKVLALKATKDEGQKVVDSGIFKPGDLVGYYTEKKGRYTHSAMFVGKQTGAAGDPGGITCHTLCRFQGLTKAWNGADDDACMGGCPTRSFTSPRTILLQPPACRGCRGGGRSERTSIASWRTAAPSPLPASRRRPARSCFPGIRPAIISKPTRRSFSCGASRAARSRSSDGPRQAPPRQQL